MFQDLYAVILDRKQNPVPGSYTASLYAQGQDKICKKIVEESMEVVLAARCESGTRLVEESADLIYHLFVLLANEGLSLEDLEAELRNRRVEAG
jgi:phosphoribosyl-ATP pyrophosphohydrolase